MAIKKGLGRGLESLFAMYDEEVGNTNITNDQSTAEEVLSNGVIELDIDKIQPNPNQPRKNFDQEALDDLACSIKIHGVIQPIVVNRAEDGKYLIIAGERRYRAAKIAGLEKIPAIVVNINEIQRIQMSLIENIQRENLNAIEEATAYQYLIDHYPHFPLEILQQQIFLF